MGEHGCLPCQQSEREPFEVNVSSKELVRRNEIRLVFLPQKNQEGLTTQWIIIKKNLS